MNEKTDWVKVNVPALSTLEELKEAYNAEMCRRLEQTRDALLAHAIDVLAKQLDVDDALDALRPEIKAIYERALKGVGEIALHYNVCHIVWDDHNFDRRSVEWQLKNACAHTPDQLEVSEAEYAFAIASLAELLMLPDEILDNPFKEEQT